MIRVQIIADEMENGEFLARRAFGRVVCGVKMRGRWLPTPHCMSTWPGAGVSGDGASGPLTGSVLPAESANSVHSLSFRNIGEPLATGRGFAILALELGDSGSTC